MGPVLAKPPFGIGSPIPASQNSQLAGYLGGSDSVAMSGGDHCGSANPAGGVGFLSQGGEEVALSPPLMPWLCYVILVWL